MSGIQHSRFRRPIEYISILLPLLVGSQVQAVHQYVCRVNCTKADGAEIGSGSGVYLGEGHLGDGIVLTAYHVVRRHAESNITVRFPRDRQWRMAEYLGGDEAHDIAALSIEAPEGVEPPLIAEASYQDGPFTCVGYPYNSRGRQRSVLGPYVPCDVAPLTRSPLRVGVKVVQGYSGGGCFNRRGEYVGVIYGRIFTGNLDMAIITSGPVLFEFLGRFMTLEEQ